MKYLHLYSFASELPHYLKWKPQTNKTETRNLIQSIFILSEKKVIFNKAETKAFIFIFLNIYLFLRVLSSFKRRRQKISMGAHRFPLYKIFLIEYSFWPYRPLWIIFLWNFLMSSTGHRWLVIKQKCLWYQVTQNWNELTKLQDIIHNSIFARWIFDVD